MPSKADNIAINNRRLDRRCKLTEEQKAEIISLRGEMSSYACAAKFGVSRRMIQFLWNPEALLRNKICRQARGGWRQYYDKVLHREYMKEHRDYKNRLYKKGLIKENENEC